jgi:heme o synthase
MSAFSQKIKDYKELTKFTLNITVVFSAVASYLLVPTVVFNWLNVLCLSVGGFLITAAANAINQIEEKDSDAKMKRTRNRPIASGRMSVSEAWGFTGVSIFIGTALLGYLDWRAAVLSLFSLLLYGFVYTPLKKVNSIAVLVGGIPGALPCLIGWVAGAHEFSQGGYVLFALQFLWQFPHFWAIAWVAHNDYDAAGFKLLPHRGGPTRQTAYQALFYALAMVPVGLLPYLLKPSISGAVSAIIILLCNFWIIGTCLKLIKNLDVKSARWVMFSSYIYLPIVFLALIFDKIHI